MFQLDTYSFNLSPKVQEGHVNLFTFYLMEKTLKRGDHSVSKHTNFVITYVGHEAFVSFAKKIVTVFSSYMLQNQQVFSVLDFELFYNHALCAA